MEGTAVGNEDKWDEEHMWLIPSVTIWARLCFKYEGMNELINGRFIEDFGILLGSATGEAKTRKSFYEIDKEFELMTKTIEKNFVKVAEDHLAGLENKSDLVATKPKFLN